MLPNRSRSAPSGRVAVLAGQLFGTQPAYQEAALHVGLCLAEQGIEVLLPGTAGGLLRAVASGVSARGGQIVEVVVRGAMAPRPAPDQVQRYEAVDIHQRYEVADFAQRQALLLDQADAVVALPGGPEVLWSLLADVTLAHLAQHSKPLALLTVGEWFTPFLHLLLQLQQTGFASVDLAQRYLLVDPDPWCLVQRLLRHPRWPEGAMHQRQGDHRPFPWERTL